MTAPHKINLQTLMETTITNKLHRKSRIAPSAPRKSRACRCDGRKAFDILMEAQGYWARMEDFRLERERNKRYAYGDQWGDMVTVGCERMTEGEYIKRQGKVALKNNLIRRLIKNVTGVYRSQGKEPTCVARDRDEQESGEQMSATLQCNMQLNRMSELYARSMEEFIISGFVCHHKSYGWRNGRTDCWTDIVQPNDFFIDNNTRDIRGWDVTCIGEAHDVSFGQLCEQFARSPGEYERLKEIYHWSHDMAHIVSYAQSFGFGNTDSYDFLYTPDPSRCRVIEVWRKEQVERYRCHDLQNGEIFRVNPEDYASEVEAVNAERRRMGAEAGIPEDEIPLIESEWFVDDAWYYYFLSPFGDVLASGETPYEHGGHPYVFKAYPFIDGEIHSFVADIIDQQRYVNRLITLYDWIMRSSAKGVLLVPRDCLGQCSVEDFAETWTEFNGVIVYEPSKSGNVPTQVAQNSTNIGISDLLNVQLKFFEDISGVNGALQGKPGYSGESAAHFNAQAQNATMSLLDMLECFSGFVVDAAYKDVKNIQQFYDEKRFINIVGAHVAKFVYDPSKMRDVEFDLSISESPASPAYRQIGNEFLMQLWERNAISVEQLLEHGSFPFSDALLQSIRTQREQMQAGQSPQGIPPELMSGVAASSDPAAVGALQGALQGGMEQ